MIFTFLKTGRTSWSSKEFKKSDYRSSHEWLKGWSRRLSHSPWWEQSTSPSPPPSSPRRLARPRRRGWSCTGDAARSCRRAPRGGATAPGRRPPRRQTRPHHEGPRNDTDGTESKEERTMALRWALLLRCDQNVSESSPVCRFLFHTFFGNQ